MSAVIKQFINDFNRLLKSDKSTLKSYFCHVWNLGQKPEPLLASVVYQMGVTKSHAVLLKIVCKASSSTVSNTLATVKQEVFTRLFLYKKVSQFSRSVVSDSLQLHGLAARQPSLSITTSHS